MTAPINCAEQKDKRVQQHSNMTSQIAALCREQSLFCDCSSCYPEAQNEGNMVFHPKVFLFVMSWWVLG
jgi:hypothetical protein